MDYSQLWWGEMIVGTRDELQALGLGCGQAFPMSADRRRRPLRCVDSRGLACEIKRYGREGRFVAVIRIPGRESVADQPSSLFPGVTMERLCFADMFRGRVEALIAAGLLRSDQLPGATGLHKTRVTFQPDGTVAPRHKHRNATEGFISVVRDGKYRVNVYRYVSDAECERRRVDGIAKREEFERRMWKLPRPAPLVAPSREAEALKRRASMRLVWSRPAPGFSLSP